MEKLFFYADVHLFSPIASHSKNDILSLEPKKNLFFMGDIVDRANCEKSKTAEATETMKYLESKHGSHFIFGNHERNSINGNQYYLHEAESGARAIFAHGDLEANFEKWTEYRDKKIGAGFLKRKFLVPFIREAEEIIDRKPKKEFLENVKALCAKNWASIYICGHFHVKEIMEFDHEGIRIVMLPRGKSELII